MKREDDVKYLYFCCSAFCLVLLDLLGLKGTFGSSGFILHLFIQRINWDCMASRFLLNES